MKDYNQKSLGLEENIINKIHKLEKRSFLIKQGFYGIISVFSFVGIIYSSFYILNNLSTSGVYNYIALIFSDIEALSYWKELSFSVLESLPFLGITIGFGVLGLFLWSILKTVKIQVLKNLVA